MNRSETLLYQVHHPDRHISRILIVPEATEALTRESVLDLEGDCLAPSRIHGYQYRETRVRVLLRRLPFYYSLVSQPNLLFTPIHCFRDWTGC